MSNDTNKIFNQHSALTTFKVADEKKGKYFDSNAEKTVLALLMKGQEDLKESYKKKLSEILNKGRLLESNIKYISQNMFKMTPYGEELSQNIDFDKITNLVGIVYKEKNAKLDKIEDPEERMKVYKRERLGDLKELTEISPNALSLDYQNKIITEIKEHAKDLAIQDNLDSKVIDLTAIVSDLNLNPTRVKKGLEKGVDTAFKFNYINRKNLDVDVTSTFITSLEINYDKKEKVSWLSYQIPKSILKLLLIPSIYIPVQEVMIKQVEGNYTLRMHGLLRDHLIRGFVELTREELFEFFMLPKSYSKKTHLVEKFLIPTLEEVEKVSGIECSYKLVPETKFRKIVFTPKIKTQVKADKIKVLSKEESIKRKQDMGTALKDGLLATTIEDVKLKNIYVSKAWNKRVDNKIKKIAKEDGERFAIYVLKELKKSLKEEVQKTLVQYINGMLKNMSPDDLEDIKEPEVLEAVIVEKEKDLLVISNEKDAKSLEEENMNNILYSSFLTWPDVVKDEIIAKARQIYLDKTNSKEFTGIHEKIYNSSKKMYIVEALKMNNENK